MTRQHRPCPICHSDQAQPLYQNTMAKIDGLDMSYQVAHCQQCMLVFADQLPASQDYETYYHGLSKYDVGTMGASSATPTVAVMSAADRLRCDAAINLIRQHAPADAAIVDVGCGSGMLLGALHDAGWSRLKGIDPAPAAPAQALALYGLDCVQCGTLDQAATQHDWAASDVVCMMGVLEHLPGLESDLVRLVSALDARTKILVEVPALECFARKSFEPFGEFSLEHIQFFSATSLTALFDKFGYAPQALSIVELPAGVCDSLMGIFVRKVHAPSKANKIVSDSTSNPLDDYLHKSTALMKAALARIRANTAHSFVIYGAGSHTARLLPMLPEAVINRIGAIVDGNPNLQGKRLGEFVIEAPAELSKYPEASIIVSSFRSQTSIAEMLRKTRPNPIITLY